MNTLYQQGEKVKFYIPKVLKGYGTIQGLAHKELIKVYIIKWEKARILSKDKIWHDFNYACLVMPEGYITRYKH